MDNTDFNIAMEASRKYTRDLYKITGTTNPTERQRLAYFFTFVKKMSSGDTKPTNEIEKNITINMCNFIRIASEKEENDLKN